MSIEGLLQYVVSGIAIGAVYALIALGFATIYRCSRIVNLAQGSFAMLGTMFVVAFLKDLGWPYLAAGIAAVVVVTLLALLMYWLVIAPILRISLIAMIMVTVGVNMLFENATLLKWGGYPLYSPAFSGTEPIMLGDVAISTQSLWVVGLTAVALLALYLLMNYTLIGKQMTATADNFTAASLVGISTGQMIALAFAISAVIGAMAGVAIGPIVPISFSSGGILSLKGFVAAALGGWGKSTGAVLGGLALGVVEAVAAAFLPSGYKDGIAFLVLLLILYLRPAGILGSSLAEAE
ncbi:MAG: branched-chain amino acid ABC transporter permease [Chloroflexi bacterium]|nr:branched-chain amino acid ABC transporter permease [Chloroflexota bacterium]